MAFEELKQKQSVVWGTGPYQNVTDTLTDIHELVIDRLDPQSGVNMIPQVDDTTSKLASSRSSASQSPTR